MNLTIGKACWLTTKYKHTCPHTKQNLGSNLITTLISTCIFTYALSTFIYT